MQKKTKMPQTNNFRRLNREAALELFTRGDLFALGKLANVIRWIKHPDPVVTYIVDRNINYTNICSIRCAFCAFSVDINSSKGYVLSTGEIIRKIDEAVNLGATQILMQGGVHPDLDLEYFEKLFRDIKSKFNVQIHSLSPSEISFLSKKTGISVQDVILRLKQAGLDSIPGGGAEMMVESVRRIISPRKINALESLDVMREAHLIGMKTTATMMFGSIESPGDIVEHLLRIRDLQDETGGFTSFIPWSYQPGNTALGGKTATGTDYLRVLALSRVVLDNVDNIQASWVTQGLKVAQIALFFGANDIGNVMIEENVVAATGVKNSVTEQDLIDVVMSAGFHPAKRNTLYEILELH